MPNSRDILAYYQGKPVSHLLHNYRFKQDIIELIYNVVGSMGFATTSSTTTTTTTA